ncbi:MULTISPECIES: DUF308 domain-containing protein [unclassified Bradyrhizobium]|uniref:DUF308 domain-containing protein n=1 Tax=unclassified Bradyrhizobium TaxID=2631580 RepID=UPI0024793499|nr:MULTISPECIES: DUF308 domain-containing protein [unclassified Bradyrhizobium]WGR68979.1 DUF308 domain-containing protein [Bradyrhizobium sp. ISRA426]WGR81034.1 DUF308 domain-containing protein [Bradyrhizobium sp. ISRA430]WGR84218.1 DUF308 domain-containing protein [Bradyrhizobium sp. ISRA432]
MTLALLIAGIVAVVAGLLAILFGIPIKEFGFGNTLILVGAIGVCSGMLLMGLYVVVLELKSIARRLANLTAPSDVRVRPVLPPGLAPAGVPMAEAASAPAMKAEPPPSPVAPPPWLDDAARERSRAEAPSAPEVPAPPPATPEAPRRRNLLFASTSRKERERAQGKAAEGLPPQPPAEPATPAAPEAPPASFDDAWPKPDRMRPAEPAASRRPAPPPRSPSAFTEAAPPASESPPPPPAPAEQPPVTVLKSGVVDGMAYSLYSDGSIEAQMPEGMMRFASIDELRAHLDQRS